MYLDILISPVSKGSTVAASVLKCNAKGFSNQADIKSTVCLNLEVTSPDIVFTLPESSATPHLCSSLSQSIKHQHQKPTNCKTCNAKPKPQNQFNRHSPNPTVVEEYLCAPPGYSESIYSRKCYRYYKQQSELLDTLKFFNLSTTQVLSLDSELEEIIHAVVTDFRTGI